MNQNSELTLPPHYDKEKTDKVWKVEYQKIAEQASRWRKQHGITPSYSDTKKLCLLLVDVQNTFCIPGFELFVAGNSGYGAVEDNKRLCDFIYRNLHRINHIIPTMDTHQAIQIFHSVFFVDENGYNPPPLTFIKSSDIESGKWRLNEEITHTLGYSVDYLKDYVRHYTEQLERNSKYDLMIWPYHAMTGGIGHALVSSVEEALFFHTICRYSQPEFQVKGDNPLTEHYSALRPEVTEDMSKRTLISRGEGLFQNALPSDSIYRILKHYDTVVIAGQAMSHCVSWTIDDIINYVPENEHDLLGKIFVLEDCTSPVVVENVVNYTEEAENNFKRFSEAGINLVKSTENPDSWI